jgi:hypothetical protein
MPSIKYSGNVLRFKGSRHQDSEGEEQLVWQGKNSEFSMFDVKQLLEATDNFSEENKLGQGGFGAVYKVNSCVYVIFIFRWNYFSLLT